MTHAELLRSHADAALREGGMYYSGEYLSRIAATAESLEAENAKLRELVAEMFNACPMCVNCAHNHLTVGWYDRMRELGVKI